MCVCVCVCVCVILFFNLVSINQTEWLTTSACPSLIYFIIVYVYIFKNGNIEGTKSSKICDCCLCMCIFFNICVCIHFVDKLIFFMTEFECPEMTLCVYKFQFLTN